MTQAPQKVSNEFIAIMASLMAICALSIDAILPAIPNISKYLELEDFNKSQQLVTMIFLGFGVGQLVLGPLSDCYGRKRLMYFGFAIFGFASIICMTTKSFEIMILGRVLQGIGLSAPRTITVSMVRDQFSGDYMGKIISLIVMIFILVPVVAPSLGQLILKLSNWQTIYGFNLFIALAVLVWFALRQKETLSIKSRIPFKMSMFTNGIKEFLSSTPAVVYTIISGFIMGSFLVYLSSTQQIFHHQYGLREEFPMIFALLSISIGISTFLNSRLVLKFGMRQMVKVALFLFIGTSALYILLFHLGNPPAAVLVAFLSIQFLSIGLLFGNLRALAMEPLGHIAGMGAGLNGFLSTVMSVPLANFIGSFVDDTALPIFVGFVICGIISYALFSYVKHRFAFA
ncbi:multidrug effflux MFS transporter [Aegicerativicinus sediminis]|uniref:multidrug effflux MFS transporter n=1 Tax=Aegicerativicinus sediminis TaxID=2893202 RepID=UPI001E5B2136|nr:multidrug effflux MFS transporter [Aegicerativicinus sediminis]